MASMLRFASAVTLLVCSASMPAAAASFPPWMSNGLYRTMTEPERAYFGRPLADALAAMDKAAQEKKHGHCVAELASGDPADPEKPGAWLRPQGILTTGGLAPSSWEVPVTCPGLHAVLSLSPTSLAVVPEPGDKPEAAGINVFSSSGVLVVGDFFISTTRNAKAPGSEGTTTAMLENMPSLAKPVAIRVRSDHSTGDLTDYLDLDAARAVLANLPPAPGRSPPAVESDVQQGDEETIRRTESSVLSYLARRSGSRAKIAIADTTWRGGLPAEAESLLPQIAPEILGSAIVSYRDKNRESRPMPTDLSVPGSSVQLINEATLRGMFQRGTEAQGWAKFAQTYGEPQLLTFSRVGLSHDLSQAVVFQGYQGARIATGSLLFLRREADTWRVMYTLRLWVE